MFELGKVYRQTNTDHVFEPQFIGKTHAFGTHFAHRLSKSFKESAIETSLPHDYVMKNYYEEYKGPRSIESRWFNIFVNMSEPDKIWLSATPYPSKEAAQTYAMSHMSGTTLVDTIMVEYTESN